jgi:hypothetical protein
MDLFASGGQGALFKKTAPWTVKHRQKLLIVGRGFLCSWSSGAGKIYSGQDNIGTGGDFL